MYHQTFLFVIVSHNDQIEQILRGITPLEDCDYSFQTVSCPQDAAVDSRRPDVAFVYDTVGGAQFPEEKTKWEEHILVAGAGSMLLTDHAAMENASGIWIMPKQGYDDNLLTVHFTHLAARMKRHADARKQGICFDTLINSVPDISWFKDKSGAHLIVNDSFCDMVDKSKEQIYKKGHCYIWNASKEDEKVCLDSDKIIMESRKTNSFEESIKTRTEVRLLKSYKSALIDVDGEIFGTCGIAHDVTALRDMSTELDMVLDSVPFVVVVENMQGIVMNKNIQFDKYFPNFEDIVGKPSEEWKSSLARKKFLDDRLKEVVIQADSEQMLVYDEEPILDNLKRSIGKIVTLTDITLERSIYQQNEYMANTDFLTGLSNRRNLMQYLGDIYMRDDISLIMVDLDNFKHVNDSFGHDAGDRALVLTAEKLKEGFPDDFVARMGGDEFMIVASGKKGDDVRASVERWISMIGSTYHEYEEFRGVTASAGIVPTAVFSEEERKIPEMLLEVDKLLYEAKRNGKNRCCYYGELQENNN